MRNFCRFFLISLTSAILFFAVQSAAQDAVVGWQTDPDLATKEKKDGYFALLKANNVDSDRQGVENFFDNYYFSRWTLPTETGSVRRFSQELLVQDFKDLPDNARTYLLNKSFDTLRKMAADQTVTSTARYNAIYTIGLLNQREAPNTTSPPVPYPQALAYLVKECEKESGNPDYIRLGALLGVRRHAILGIADAPMKDATVPALMTKIIQDDKPIQTRGVEEQEILDCFRARALETLGALKSTGSRGEIVELLLSLMENSQESIDMRCHAVSTFADLNFQAASTQGVPIDYEMIGRKILNLVKEIGVIELQRVETAYNREKVKTGSGGRTLQSDMPSGMSSDMLSGMGGVGSSASAQNDETKQEITNTIQRLKTELFCIMNGIRGPRSTGATTIGVFPMLPADDPIATKLNLTARAVSALSKFLDEGPPATPGPRPTAGAGGLGGGLGGMDGMMGGPKLAPDPKAPKVNLSQIREELQEFNAKIDKIISG